MVLSLLPNDRSGFAMMAVAAVDIGILNLTAFQPPDPDGHYLGQRRLGVALDSIRCLPETAVEQILGHAEQEKPQLMVIDSIQTVYTENLASAPGSVAQIRESAAALVRWAKLNRCCIVLVGHVTKEGALAGPRVLEHMVDTVLYFESDPSSRYTMIRSVKNRFGATGEMGVFAMTGKGFREVRNPSAIFLSRDTLTEPGSVV